MILVYFKPTFNYQANVEIMSNSRAENSLDYATSCSVEDAVMYLLGYKQSEIQAIWYQSSNDPSDGEWLSSFGFDHLKDSLEFAESEFTEAKYDKCPDEVIAEKLAKLNECMALNKQAHGYRSAVIDELAKGASSQLLIDSLATRNFRDPFITLLSLKRWAHHALKISVLEDLDSPPLKSSAPKSQKNIPSSNYPWWEVHEKDTPPPPNEHWYTAARYFARQYIADNPKLSITKEKLAAKVASIMTENKIVHSGNKPYVAGTVRKAFVNVNF